MKKEKLTKNQQTVLSLLEQSNEPLKAYTILSGTQKKGIKAPTQVSVSYTHLTLPTILLV